MSETPPPSTFFTGDITSLITSVDPNTRLTATAFAVGGSESDIHVLRANCVVSTSPDEFVVTSDPLTENFIEVQYQTGTSEWSKETIAVSSIPLSKIHAIPQALRTFIRSGVGKTAQIRYLTSNGQNTVPETNKIPFWTRELEISRSRTTSFGITSAPVVLGASLLSLNKADFFVDKDSIVLLPGVTIQDWKLKVSNLLLSSVLWVWRGVFLYLFTA